MKLCSGELRNKCCELLPFPYPNDEGRGSYEKTSVSDIPNHSQSMHTQANARFIHSLRTSRGGVGGEMLKKLCVPSKPKSGWIKMLARAPFLLESATRDEIAGLWRKASEKPEPFSKVYSLHTEPEREPRSVVTVHFDGGTPCNIPRLGYGIGYGSFQINGGPVVRVDHKRPMSNNAAEIWTLCSALDSLIKSGAVDGIRLVVHGDSQIALKWARASRKMRSTKTGSDEFKNSIVRLCELTPQFHSLLAEWKPRFHAVKAFGH